MIEKTTYIFESPDKGKTVYRREFGETKKVEIPEQIDWIEVLSETLQPK
jgi:hypothetical protein